eukprot:3105086-Rhodomonas_salina.2
MCDPSFRQYPGLFPFADPICLVNSKDLTDAQVNAMHRADTQTLEFTDKEEAILVQEMQRERNEDSISQAVTQQADTVSGESVTGESVTG